MYIFILIYRLEDAKRLVTLQGKLQGSCVVRRHSWALQIHCNPRVPLGDNHLISKGWIEILDTVLQRIYVIQYRLCILGKRFARPFEVTEPSFPGSCFAKAKSICFWFQTMKNDWVWRKVFERFVTILNVWVDIIRVLFFQLVSFIKKLDSKFENFLDGELKILKNNLIQDVYLFIVFYCLEYAKGLVT